ncbi:MAG: peptidase, partial [Aquifex sp.]
KYLLKEIGCYPGEILVTKGLDYYCDGRYLGTAKQKGSDGRIVGHFEYNGTVPEGEYFMRGTHPRSYDSRYFGFVKRAAVVRGAKPIW